MATTGLAMIFQGRCSVRTSLCSFLVGLFGTNWKGNWVFRGGELSRYLALVPASLELHCFAPDVALERETEGDLLLADMGQV